MVKDVRRPRIAQRARCGDIAVLCSIAIQRIDSGQWDEEGIQALAQALRDFNKRRPAKPPDYEVPKNLESLLAQPLSVLELTPKATEALEDINIQTIRQLYQQTEAQLREKRGIGTKIFNQITKQLWEKLRLKLPDK